MARRSSQDRTRLHPEGSGVAESHRGVVAHVPKTGFGRGGLRRQLRDRSGEEGRYAAAKPESEGMGVGSSSQTTEAPEAHFCVPYLRNGALERCFSEIRQERFKDHSFYRTYAVGRR